MPIPFKQGMTAQLYDTGTTTSGGQVLGTLGLNGQLNFSNIALGEGGIPVGVANTGSTTAAGIVTLGTALPRIYPAIWLWFPAAVVTGDATGGFYFCVMTSTTVGQIFLTPGKQGGATGFNVVTLPFQPSFPSSLVTPTSGFAVGAYTGSTAEIFAVNVTLPPGLMGLQGRCRITSHQTCNNSAGAKTFKTYLGASQIGQSGSYTTSTGGTQMISVRNAGAENFNHSQIVGGTATGAAVYTAVQTNAAAGTPFFALSMQAAVATDVVLYEGYAMELIPKD